jgi:hypothetical protein
MWNRTETNHHGHGFELDAVASAVEVLKVADD